MVLLYETANHSNLPFILTMKCKVHYFMLTGKNTTLPNKRIHSQDVF